MSPAEARRALDSLVREQLREAWERGLETAPHGFNALADSGAPAAFDAVQRAVDAYASEIARVWRERAEVTA